jgi:hypothetical protein
LIERVERGYSVITQANRVFVTRSLRGAQLL